MRWNTDGQKICIVYEDGVVIVGSVDGKGTDYISKGWFTYLKLVKCFFKDCFVPTLKK